MTYATRNDMTLRYGDADLIQLTDVDEPYTGAIVDAVLERALADGAELMDAYLRVRYSLPISPAPDILARLNCTIAYRNLHRNGAPEEIEKAYADALRTLGLIRDRKMDIGIADSEPDQASSGDVRFVGADRVFSGETLEDY